MSVPKRAAAKPKAAAALAEKKNDVKTFEFRGITLTLEHKVLPGTLYFDFAAIEKNQQSMTAQVELIRSLIGDDQLAVVRDKVAEDEIPLTDMDSVFAGLFDSALEAYGITSGE